MTNLFVTCTFGRQPQLLLGGGAENSPEPLDIIGMTKGPTWLSVWVVLAVDEEHLLVL